MEKAQFISIVILTYNRKILLKDLLLSISKIKYKHLEIIVVDNHSDEPVLDMISSEFPHVILLQMEENTGVAARNRGISYASGDIIITLDDDIIGINDEALYKIIKIFNNPEIGAVCFKVHDARTDKITNWCHHYPVEEFSEQPFITNEITEGAVAFRKATLDLTGLYPGSFFISHEGPDLAYRIMNKGYYVIYSPEIIVKHYHSELGRTDWRRYYFDTRNILWLSARNHPFFYAVKYLFIGLTAMLVYSIRDGYLRYWIKGLKDGFLGIKMAFSERCLMSERTLRLVRNIEKNRPSFIFLLRKRLFQKKIQI